LARTSIAREEKGDRNWKKEVWNHAIGCTIDGGQANGNLGPNWVGPEGALGSAHTPNFCHESPDYWGGS
jgi:hypothetical protein